MVEKIEGAIGKRINPDDLPSADPAFVGEKSAGDFDNYQSQGSARIAPGSDIPPVVDDMPSDAVSANPAQPADVVAQDQPSTQARIRSDNPRKKSKRRRDTGVDVVVPAAAGAAAATAAGTGGGERTPRPVAAGRDRTPPPAVAAGPAPRPDARPDAGPAATPAARPDAVGVAPDEAAFDAMRAQLEAARRENEAEHARTLARATAERDAFKEQNTALLRAFGIRYGSGAQEVLEATMRACPLSGTPEQIAENQRIINAVIDRKNSLYASGARISKEGVPALVNTIRNEQKLKWWERFGLGKALLGSVFSGSAGALGSLAVFGCLAAPLVAAGATAGAAFALVKRRLERSNALGKGKTFLHRNPGATAAVFSVVSGLGAGAHMPDGSAYMGAFVEKLADGSKEGVGKILQLFARLRMPF